MTLVSTAPGYQAPAVTVSAALPKRGSAAVLIVPVVGDGDRPAVVGGPFLDAESVGEIEVALQALGAKAGPEQLTRYNMYTSAMINGEAAQGYSSGQAIEALEEVAASMLPRGFAYEWSGMTREEIASGNQVIFIFLICFIFVYLLLAAQYESFLLPLPVLLSLPFGMFGSLFLLWVFGLENNIYAQVAMVMLIGALGLFVLEVQIARRSIMIGPGTL